MTEKPSGERETVTACVLLIGDEILSGRTQDKNLSFISTWLNERGIQVREARVIPDVEAVIVDTVNEVRAKYDYVFTTGGIGPTHDDITADCIAKAFGVPIDYHPEAYATLEKHYASGELGAFNEARKRMARIPDGAALIDNPVSKAPGFQIGNVFVMAGIPMIMQVMLEGLEGRLTGGAAVLSRTISAHLAEGQVAQPLRELQARFPNVSFGSYPFYRGDTFGVSLVLRSTRRAELDSAAEALIGIIEGLGAAPIEAA